MSSILITGATGFVGSNLTRRLVARGSDIHIVIRKGSNLWRIRDILPRLTVHKADLADARAVERAVRKIKPKIIYHVAAHGLFLKQEEANHMISSNILGTVNLLEAVRAGGTVKKFVNVGSFAEYDVKHKHISERTLLHPINAYGASKASQSLLAQYYGRFYAMPIVVVRPSLIYGPYEEPRRLVPAAILAHMNNKPLELSSPHPRKDFLFMEDALDALEIAAARNVAPGEVINITTGKDYTIRDVVTTVQRLAGARVPLEWNTLKSRPWDSSRRHTFAMETASTMLGWKPRHTFEEGLTKTIQWFTENHTLYP